MPPLSALAPAKVNLFLHVGAVDGEGYHPVFSLMSFAEIGDRVTLDPAADFVFEIQGEFGDLTGPTTDNLMMRAARAFFRAVDQAPRGRLRLDKVLPVAAGLGGGSSDAGAALRLLRQAYAPRMSDVALTALAAGLGADGAACLAARPVLASGRGERLAPAPAWPGLPAVLVNPRAPSPTGAVYRAYDEGPVRDARTFPPPDLHVAPEIAAWLSHETRNDLQPAAIHLTPVVGEVLQVLRDRPECLLARMSGSGATCFALCQDMTTAEALSAWLAAMNPDWWVRACVLGGP